MMELHDGERELTSRYSQADGLEVALVWNSVIQQTYTKVHDHKTGEQFNAVAPEGIHPRETFTHPFVYRIGDIATATGVELVVSEEGKGSQ